MAHLHTHADDITLTAGSEKEPKMKVKEESEKAGLKVNSAFKKLRSWHRVPSFMANRCENNGNSETIIIFFLAPKSL